jgi:hypothetical protein
LVFDRESQCCDQVVWLTFTEMNGYRELLLKTSQVVQFSACERLDLR